jgi:hypothetical protein
MPSLFLALYDPLFLEITWYLHTLEWKVPGQVDDLQKQIFRNDEFSEMTVGKSEFF